MDDTLANHSDAPRETVAIPNVTAPGIAGVRRSVIDAARDAGLPTHQAQQFGIAVNEVVINAIQHGGGTADVTITVETRRLIVEVRDHGIGLTDTQLAAAALPPTSQTHGRGLWLAKQLSDEVAIQRDNGGTHIRLVTTTPAEFT